MDKDDLYEAALKLAAAARADLALKLLDTLDSEYAPGVEEAWRVEVGRRLVNLERGKEKTIPWPEARESLRWPLEHGPRRT